MEETTVEKADSWNARFDSLARFSGLPLNTGMTHSLMQFVASEGTKEAYKAAISFIPNRSHHFLTFIGEPGRGKTHLAIGIGWQWISHLGTIVKYWQVEQLLDMMRREFDSPPLSEYALHTVTVFEWAERAALLILDDLGAERGTEWAIAKLDELIDFRYINALPTVFTTNLAPAQLPSRISSRLKEGVAVPLGGPDYREIKATVRRGSR